MREDSPGQNVPESAQESNQLMLLLIEQIKELIRRLDEPNRAGTSQERGLPSADGAFKFADSQTGNRLTNEGDRLIRAVRPPLPDPRLVRKIIQQRQMRARFLDGDLFADPAWDMLLDLTASRVEHVRVSVTSLCIASCVPPTTALRWISQMIDAGLFERFEDETDRRRAFLQLTDRAIEAMSRYFHELGKSAVGLI